MWKRRFVVDKSSPRVRASDPDMTVESFLAGNHLGEEERRRLAKIEQGGPEWLAIKGRFMSGTGVGPAAGESDYDGPDDLLRKRLWPELDPPSEAMLLGVRDEKFCSISLEHGLLRMLEGGTADSIPIPPAAAPATPAPMARLGFCVAPPDRLRFEDAGFLIPDQEGTPWIGVSPDAIISYRGHMVLGEFKRPMDGRFYSQKKHRRTGIPKAYVAQIQSIMNMMQIEWCFFAVMSEKQGVETRLFKRDPAYWDRVGRAARDFYFQRLVPAMVAKARGLLRLGETEPDFGVCRPFDAAGAARAEVRAAEEAAKASRVPGFEPRVRVLRLNLRDL
jgi:hypothetical protein